MAQQSFAVFAAGLALASSFETQPMPAPAIAFRYDDSHVLVVLRDLHSYRLGELAGLYDFNAPRGRWDPDRVAGSPVDFFEADLGVWEREFGSPPLGTTWALQLSMSASTTCSVDQVGVAGLSGCYNGLVALCEVSSDGMEAFRAVSADHFITAAPDANSLAVPNPEIDLAVSETERSAIERELQNLLQHEVALMREEMEPIYEREYRRTGPPRTRTGPDWLAEALSRWRGFDERLAAGEGILEFDVTKLVLGPEPSPRYFVRAHWKLGGDVAFVVGAWARIGDEVVIEHLDTDVSRRQRMPELHPFDVDKTWLGEILNVVDVNGDGSREVIFLSRGYEGMHIRALEYGPDGPGEALVSYGAGC